MVKLVDTVDLGSILHYAGKGSSPFFGSLFMFYRYNLSKQTIVSVLSNHLENYPTPTNITYFWGLGSLAGIVLVNQLITGICLAMHYCAHVDLAFISIEHIIRDVFGGNILKFAHATGASFFFIALYIHMFRGLYFGSYYAPRHQLWYSGVVVFLLVMATAFMGYVLPWGQMSFWGATVITNLFSAVPLIGDELVKWLWGGFSVSNPTLNRFFSIHYLLPFVIAALAFTHLILLHENGSNNPLGLRSDVDKISFYPYFYVKDLLGLIIFSTIFMVFVMYDPDYLGHPDNYILADPLVTPAHIVPEWYFLPFYCILRAIPDKLGGVIMMVAAIIILFFLPNLDNSRIRSNFFKPFHLVAFWIFFGVSILLGWLGQKEVEHPFIEAATFFTVFYFSYFLIIVPFFSRFERLFIHSLLEYKN